MIINKVRVKGKCTTRGCHNEPKGKFCGSCYSRQSRLRDLVRYSFNNKKHRAEERGIFWDLTLDQFRQFCQETEYMSKCGKKTGSYDVDRVIEGKTPGYTISNIQILDKIKNIKKYKAYNVETKKSEVVIQHVTEIIDKESLPF
jgi:hypothetical protein